MASKYWSQAVRNTPGWSGSCRSLVLMVGVWHFYICTQKGVNDSNLPHQMQWCADAGLIKAPIGKLHWSNFCCAKIASNGKKWQARGGADTSAAAIIRPSFMHQPKPPHFLFVLKFQIQIDTRQGHPMPLCMAGGLAWYHPTPNTPKPYVPMDSWSMNEKNWNTAWKMLSFQSKN